MTAEHKAAIARGVKIYHTKCKIGKKIVKASAKGEPTKVKFNATDGKVIIRTTAKVIRTKKDRRPGPRPMTPQL